LFGTFNQVVDNGASRTAIPFPAALTHVVPVNTNLNPYFGAPANWGRMHYEKIQKAFDLIVAQGYDPSTDSEMLYTIMRSQDWSYLKSSVDSSGRLILADSDFNTETIPIYGTGEDAITRVYHTLFGGKLRVIIDDGFFSQTINQKTTGITAGGATPTLVNGRRIPMFIGKRCFQWGLNEIEPLELVKPAEKHAYYLMKETVRSGLVRVQEQGMVEIEVADSYS
jgi:hypothetical protein